MGSLYFRKKLQNFLGLGIYINMREINVVKRARTHGAQLCRLYKLNLKLDKYVWICSINKKNYETKKKKTQSTNLAKYDGPNRFSMRWSLVIVGDFDLYSFIYFSLTFSISDLTQNSMDICRPNRVKNKATQFKGDE